MDYSKLNAGNGVSVNLTLGRAVETGGLVDTLSSIEYVTGSQYADTLIGGAGNNRLNGGGNNDFFQDLTGGDDTFQGVFQESK